MGGSLHALPHGWRLRERRRYGALEWPSSTAAPPRHEEDVLRNEDGRFVAMFAYTDAVAERYPTIRAGVMHATGLVNRPSSSELLDDYRAEQQAASERLKAMAIADLPSIAAWRRAFARFGAKPTQHRNAAEALLRRLAKHGDIPTVNTLVDIGNLVSIRHALPVAVFDLANIDGCITVRFATGDELFTDLGSTGSIFPDPGEVIFVDSNNVVSARRWCWRQSAQSATSATTADALVVIEGHHDTAGQDVEAALTDLTSLLASPIAPRSRALDGRSDPAILSARFPTAGIHPARRVRRRLGILRPPVSDRIARLEADPRLPAMTTRCWRLPLLVDRQPHHHPAGAGGLVPRAVATLSGSCRSVSSRQTTVGVRRGIWVSPLRLEPYRASTTSAAGNLALHISRSTSRFGRKMT